jgi:hypothetical protein
MILLLQGAIELVEYFKITAVKVRSIINDTNPLDKLLGPKRKLYDTLSDETSTAIAIEKGKELNIAPSTVNKKKILH